MRARSSLRCPDCTTVLRETAQRLEPHLRERGYMRGEFICPGCRGTACTRRAMLYHMRSCDNYQRFKSQHHNRVDDVSISEMYTRSRNFHLSPLGAFTPVGVSSLTLYGTAVAAEYQAEGQAGSQTDDQAEQQADDDAIDDSEEQPQEPLRYPEWDEELYRALYGPFDQQEHSTGNTADLTEEQAAMTEDQPLDSVPDSYFHWDPEEVMGEVSHASDITHTVEDNMDAVQDTSTSGFGVQSQDMLAQPLVLLGARPDSNVNDADDSQGAPPETDVTYLPLKDQRYPVSSLDVPENEAAGTPQQSSPSVTLEDRPSAYGITSLPDSSPASQPTHDDVPRGPPQVISYQVSLLESILAADRACYSQERTNPAGVRVPHSCNN